MDIIKLPGIGYDSNIYIIKEKDSAHIVDTGTGEHSGYISDKILETTDPRMIQSIILTHEHFDHTGGLLQLSGVCTNAKVMMHKKCKQALDEKLEWTSTAMGQSLPPINTLLEHGDDIVLESSIFEILYTPGHSIGSICLYCEKEKILISGDTVFSHGGFGRTDIEGGNINDLIKSLKNLQALTIEDIYPGHGPHIIKKGQYHLNLSLNAASSFY